MTEEWIGHRELTNISMKSAYGIIDGVSVALANKHKSKYSNIYFWYIVAAAMSPAIVSVTTKDSEDSLNNDYSLTYYIADGFLLLCILTLISNVDFACIRDSKNKEFNPDHKSGFKALPQLISIPSMILTLGIGRY